MTTTLHTLDAICKTWLNFMRLATKSFSLEEFFFLLFLNLPLYQRGNRFSNRLGLNLFFLLIFNWLPLHPRPRHPHHRIRHPVRLLLVLIPRLADLKLSLQGPRPDHSLHSLIADGPLEVQYMVRRRIIGLKRFRLVCL